MFQVHGELSAQEIEQTISRAETGILSTKGLDEYPYSVPVNYVYTNGKLFIHGKATGMKVRNIARDPHVVFCVLGRAAVLPEEYTVSFESVLIYGTARLLSDPGEKYRVMRALMNKYSPGVHAPCMDDLAERDSAALGIIEITIERITGRRSAL